MTFIEKARFRKQAQKKFKSLGKDRFVELSKKIFDTRYDVQVDASTNRMDEAIVIRQLQDLLFSITKIPDANIDTQAVIKEMLDLMGISGTRFTKANQAPQQTQLNPGSAQKAQPTASVLGESQRANVQGGVSAGERPV